MLRFDYSGHGASGGQFEDGTIGAWTRDALTVLDRLTEGKLILVGSSMGGWIALLAALQRPERIAAIVGIAAAPDFTEKLMWDAMTFEERARLMRDGILRIPEPVWRTDAGHPRADRGRPNPFAAGQSDPAGLQGSVAARPGRSRCALGTGVAHRRAPDLARRRDHSDQGWRSPAVAAARPRRCYGGRSPLSSRQMAARPSRKLGYNQRKPKDLLGFPAADLAVFSPEASRHRAHGGKRVGEGDFRRRRNTHQAGRLGHDGGAFRRHVVAEVAAPARPAPASGASRRPRRGRCRRDGCGRTGGQVCSSAARYRHADRRTPNALDRKCRRGGKYRRRIARRTATRPARRRGGAGRAVARAPGVVSSSTQAPPRSP